MNFVQSLMKPFHCELKSALNGVRLMKSLLEVIASNIVQSFKDLRIFLESTLIFNLLPKQCCHLCSHSIESNTLLFSNDSNTDQDKLRDAYLQYQLSLYDFDLNQIKETSNYDDECKNCLFEFIKIIIKCLQKFSFLVIELSED